MEYPQARYGYHHAHTEADIPSDAPQYFAEPESAVLEPALLNADIMQPPDATQLRKGSFINNNDILTSGQPHQWNAQYGAGAGALSMDSPSAASAPYHDDHTRFEQDSAHPMPPPFGHAPQPQSWSYEPGSGDCTPTNRMDFEPPPTVHGPFEHPHYAHQRNDSARGSFSHPIPRPPFNAPEQTFISAGPVQTPMSPHSHQDWMIMAAQESEGKPHPRRMRAQSPHPPTVDFQRRDGIRKKNARIDIPHERSIQTIEQLLETTTDEELLKELKQQKRLLRNREAALASRQRKKKHTEDLEQKEKDFTRSMETHVIQIENLARDCSHLKHNNNILHHEIQDLRRTVEMLEQEKNEIKRMHENETSVLRKRLHALQDEIQHGLPPAMSAAPSSTGFADFNAGMESLSMGVQDWDDLIFASDLQNDLLDDLSFDSNHEPSAQQTPIDRNVLSTALAPVPTKSSTETASDQSVTSGLLFFLLLCGAFVASKPPNSQTSDLPQVPAHVRAAAPKVLSNLLYESPSSMTSTTVRTPLVEDSEPAASNIPHPVPKSRGSRLDRMHHRLTAPTRQQEVDSAFSLTTQEYASIANLDYPLVGGNEHQDAAPPAPRHRRPLAEAMQNVQDDSARHGHDKAAVYTRSVLWESCPEETLRQFREFIRDWNEDDAQQQQQRPQRQNHDDTTTEFKRET